MDGCAPLQYASPDAMPSARETLGVSLRLSPPLGKQQLRRPGGVEASR